MLEKHGILKCKKAEVEKISKSLIVSAEVGSFGAEVMVNDRKAAQKLYPDMVIEPAALEQIMIFYVNKRQSRREVRS